MSHSPTYTTAAADRPGPAAEPRARAGLNGPQYGGRDPESKVADDGSN